MVQFVFRGSDILYPGNLCGPRIFRHLAYHPFLLSVMNIWAIVTEKYYLIYLSIHKKALDAIFTSMNVKYIKSLFGPLILPVLISWQYLFLASPILLQHMLSDNPSEHSIYYHYGSTIAPFIFMAVAGALKLCFQKFNRKTFNIILFFLVFSLISFLYCFLDPFFYKLNYHHDHLDAVRWDFVNAIPAEEGVIATFDYLTPLSLRKYLYAFHKVYNESYQNPQEIKSSELNTGRSFTLPDQVHYALIDFKDPWIKQSLKYWPQETTQRIRMFLKMGHWQVVKSCGTIVLLRR